MPELKLTLLLNSRLDRHFKTLVSYLFSCLLCISSMFTWLRYLIFRRINKCFIGRSGSNEDMILRSLLKYLGPVSQVGIIIVI